ncbi:hypothetical protein ABZ745_31685 [Streptomyces sp. NPDC013082]|uniref:hypothetical protein n=1 Tax=Streptomyces TaxID=1883 RepID=UPI0033F585A8
MKARFCRCGHGSGPIHPGDQTVVAEFTAMLAARQRPTPCTGRGDAAVQIGECGLERGRPLPGQQPDADPVALVLIHPGTEAALTGTLPCARSLIHGAWTDPYRLLTHTLAGRTINPDFTPRHDHVQQIRRTAALAVTALAVVLTLTACGATTQSPEHHESRMKKAAGIGSLSIVCNKDIWTDTRPDGLKKVTVTPADGERGQRGMVRVTLTGAQLVAYLNQLDQDAHPGWMGANLSDREALSGRVYDALAPAVDKATTSRSTADPAPEILIDDTLATKAP